MGCRMEMENPLKALQRRPCGGFGMVSRTTKAQQRDERRQPQKILIVSCSKYVAQNPECPMRPSHRTHLSWYAANC